MPDQRRTIPTPLKHPRQKERNPRGKLRETKRNKQLPTMSTPMLQRTHLGTPDTTRWVSLINPNRAQRSALRRPELQIPKSLHVSSRPFQARSSTLSRTEREHLSAIKNMDGHKFGEGPHSVGLARASSSSRVKPRIRSPILSPSGSSACRTVPCRKQRDGRLGVRSCGRLNALRTAGL